MWVLVSWLMTLLLWSRCCNVKITSGRHWASCLRFFLLQVKPKLEKTIQGINLNSLREGIQHEICFSYIMQRHGVKPNVKNELKQSLKDHMISNVCSCLLLALLFSLCRLIFILQAHGRRWPPNSLQGHMSPSSGPSFSQGQISGREGPIGPTWVMSPPLI